MPTPKIVVVGSCNIDLTIYVSSLPQPGETIDAHKLIISHGGKGANQCVAAARLGASTAMLGGDVFGARYREELKAAQINTDFLKISDETSCGSAIVTVDTHGVNTIVIVPGANHELSPEDVISADLFIRNAEVVVLQLEVPVNTIIAALKLCYSVKTKSILNAAPGSNNFDKCIFNWPDIFCVNGTEAEKITGLECITVSQAGKSIKVLLKKGCSTVIITLGANGVVFATADNPKPQHVATENVNAVDTTGAGDAFIGALAFYLAYLPALPLQMIISRCCCIATATVMKHGTQKSFPYQNQLSDSLFHLQ